jgi:hypothetical protein
MTITTTRRDIFDARGIATRLEATLAAYDAEFDAEDAAEDAAAEQAPAIEDAVADKQAGPARCLGCRRPIRSARALARSYGEGCWRKARRRASELGAAYSDEQIEKAVEAVEDGAVIPGESAAVWLVVSSRGDEVYEVAGGAVCTCPAGEAGRGCWHLAAVEMISA